MPIYEYECGRCGGRFEVTQKFSDPLLSACKLCNATGVRKVLDHVPHREGVDLPRKSAARNGLEARAH